MPWLTLLLLFKIGFTALFCALPMLLLPTREICRRLGVDRAAVPYIRLYGWVLVALLTGYAAGVVDTLHGVMPWGVVVMGLVSNGGATVLMLTPFGRTQSAAMPLVFGLIALGLAGALLLPDLALRHAW